MEEVTLEVIWILGLGKPLTEDCPQILGQAIGMLPLVPVEFEILVI